MVLVTTLMVPIPGRPMLLCSGEALSLSMTSYANLWVQLAKTCLIFPLLYPFIILPYLAYFLFSSDIFLDGPLGSFAA